MDERASLHNQQNHKNVAQKEEVRMVPEMDLIEMLNIELFCQSNPYILISPPPFPHTFSKWNKKEPKHFHTIFKYWLVLKKKKKNPKEELGLLTLTLDPSRKVHPRKSSTQSTDKFSDFDFEKNVSSFKPDTNSKKFSKKSHSWECQEQKHNSMDRIVQVQISSYP